ncbi:MAG: hypothetical protein K2N79_00405, partial [Muribaculaceae bacterium]|nr:hypothetical protein [Muribaculaceae bacterium]
KRGLYSYLEIVVDSIRCKTDVDGSTMIVSPEIVNSDLVESLLFDEHDTTTVAHMAITAGSDIIGSFIDNEFGCRQRQLN